MNEATLLLRQIHPNWIVSGRVSSQAFRPTRKDGGRLSVYDGDLIEPEPSWRHYTERLGLLSAGVLAVTVRECAEAELAVEADPTPYPEHAVIDFGGLGPGDVQSRAQRLVAAARARGWLYQAQV